jgi:uncharacterized membrane protein HdeD (DUF308 family)
MTIPLWRLLAGLYFVIVGAVTLLSLSFDGLQVVVGIAALIAGIALWFFGDRALA